MHWLKCDKRRTSTVSKYVKEQPINREQINQINARLSWIKILAIAAMVWDHAAYGWIIHHDMHTLVYEAWRAPGRLSMPIFAFLIGWNYAHNTRNPMQYIKRLALFAVGCEPLFYYYFGYHGNAFVPLALGAYGCYAASQKGHARNAAYAGCLALTAAAALYCRAPDIAAQTAITVLAYQYASTNRVTYLLAAVILCPFLNAVCTIYLLMQVITCATIAWALWGNATPQIRLPRPLAYWFYPLHIVLLTYFMGPA